MKTLAVQWQFDGPIAWSRAVILASTIVQSALKHVFEKIASVVDDVDALRFF